MANAQQQPQRPLMDNILLNEIINGNAFESLEIVIVNPGAPLADLVLNRMPVLIGPSNAERLLRGVTSDGDGVLHVAARSENIILLRAIFELWSGTVDVAATNKRGETALHCAAATGNAEMVTLLMSRENNAPDNDKKRQLLRMKKHNGETCLHDAVRCGISDAVKTLVDEDVKVALGPNDSRALVKMLDKQGVSPLYLATTSRKLEIVQFLTQVQEPVGTYPAASFDGPGNKTALHAAVLLNKELSVHLAEWKNELINKADEFGSTPLHLLASTKDKCVLKLLLDLDRNAGYHADNEGSLPIHVAAANGSLEIVKLLSEHRTSCSWTCNNQGQTILHIAVQNVESNVVDYVCSEQKFEQILNSRDIDGNTALHLAVLEGNQLIFCRLMRWRAISLSVRNKDERTPLDLASLSNPPDILFSKTPRHWIMYALVAAGADYGTCTSGRVPSARIDVSKADQDKVSKSIGKSAAVLAICAVLTLTTSIAQPFTVTAFYHKTEQNLATRFAYRIFVISDGVAFGLAVASVSSCTLAGFSFTDQRKQFMCLTFGLTFLIVAAMCIILAFMGGSYLAVGSAVDTWTALFTCLLGLLFPLILLTALVPASTVLLHTRALSSRLGFSGWSSALICLLPPVRMYHDGVTIRYRDRVTIRYCGHCLGRMARPFVVIAILALVALLALASAKFK